MDFLLVKVSPCMVNSHCTKSLNLQVGPAEMGPPSIQAYDKPCLPTVQWRRWWRPRGAKNPPFIHLHSTMLHSAAGGGAALPRFFLTISFGLTENEDGRTRLEVLWFRDWNRFRNRILSIFQNLMIPIPVQILAKIDFCTVLELILGIGIDSKIRYFIMAMIPIPEKIGIITPLDQSSVRFTVCLRQS